METVTERERLGAVGGQPLDSVSHDPQQPQTGKLRKSALRFFAGRKSICMLPSFFGGRAKNQGRGASTKGGVTKSQTYDGASGTCWEGDDVTSSEFEFHNPNGASGAQRTQEGFGKSRSLPRPKRGLRGLFSSIRRRRNRNTEPEKVESFEMSSGEIVPATLQNLDVGAPKVDEATELPARGPGEKMLLEKQRSEGTIQGEDDLKVVEEEEEVKKKSGLVVHRQPLSTDSEMSHLNDFPDPPMASASSDNLVFGDVSSLKSFDSLTGCGDIIADQDDVSIAESSVSGERGGRNAGKRSSCLVTYQGGGEEMATPDEVDNEYLTSLWESEGSEVCYLPSEHTVSPDQPTGSFQVTSSGNTGTSPLGVTDAALTPTDLLSPQSDQQGSVPNSDEGYYESTTPGAEEEARERMQRERLPRDSYSGDALYEFFEPDDRLLSPSLPSGGGKSKGDLIYALTSTAPETGATETEEERLSRIQHALLCCELQNLRNSSKDQLPYRCFGDTKTRGGEHETLATEPLWQQVSHALNDAQIQHGVLYEPSSPHTSDTPSPLQESERGEVSDDGFPPPTRVCSQSQEELMVCFSQALVDFTKNSRRYRNSTESLDGSETSSPFGPSLSALPAIVTFDVVDMENEGECEQPEEEEELASPYEEAFEDDGCYLQQDAFAECDQRTFDAYEQSLLLGHAWGIASLPRHLSLNRPRPPVPAPLSLNRRSRSLDTDGLEFRSDLYSSMVSHHKKESGCDSSQRTETASGYITARPTHLPLQAAYRTGAEGDFPVTGPSDLYPCSYPPAGTQWKSRPVGVTHGICHRWAESSESRRTENEGLKGGDDLRK